MLQTCRNDTPIRVTFEPLTNLKHRRRNPNEGSHAIRHLTILNEAQREPHHILHRRAAMKSPYIAA